MRVAADTSQWTWDIGRLCEASSLSHPYPTAAHSIVRWDDRHIGNIVSSRPLPSLGVIVAMYRCGHATCSVVAELHTQITAKQEKDTRDPAMYEPQRTLLVSNALSVIDNQHLATPGGARSGCAIEPQCAFNIHTEEIEDTSALIKVAHTIPNALVTMKPFPFLALPSKLKDMVIDFVADHQENTPTATWSGNESWYLHKRRAPNTWSYRHFEYHGQHNIKALLQCSYSLRNLAEAWLATRIRCTIYIENWQHCLYSFNLNTTIRLRGPGQSLIYAYWKASIALTFPTRNIQIMIRIKHIGHARDMAAVIRNLNKAILQGGRQHFDLDVLFTFDQPPDALAVRVARFGPEYHSRIKARLLRALDFLWSPAQFSQPFEALAKTSLSLRITINFLLDVRPVPLPHLQSTELLEEKRNRLGESDLRERPG